MNISIQPPMAQPSLTSNGQIQQQYGSHPHPIHFTLQMPQAHPQYPQQAYRMAAPTMDLQQFQSQNVHRPYPMPTVTPRPIASAQYNYQAANTQTAASRPPLQTVTPTTLNQKTQNIIGNVLPQLSSIESKPLLKTDRANILGYKPVPFSKTSNPSPSSTEKVQHTHEQAVDVDLPLKSTLDKSAPSDASNHSSIVYESSKPSALSTPFGTRNQAYVNTQPTRVPISS